MLADDLGVPFVELNRVIERLAGCDVSEIHSLYGPSAYRRYELRALEETVAQHIPKAVIATPAASSPSRRRFNLLLARCFTVWLRASPEEHMARVVAQGDMRPMAGNTEAMADLKRILAGREAFYAKADLAFDTGGKTLADAFWSFAAMPARVAVAGPPSLTCIICIDASVICIIMHLCYADADEAARRRSPMSDDAARRLPHRPVPVSALEADRSTVRSRRCRWMSPRTAACATATS